jgi:hypothetical protein
VPQGTRFGSCIRSNFFDAARTDATRRTVHDAFEGTVIIAIRYQAQIGEGIFDLGALEKPKPAVYSIWQAGIDKRLLEHT